MHKKCIIVIAVIIIIASGAGMVFSNELNNQSGLIFTVFRPELQKASDDFYSEYLSDSPAVANYSGKVISLKKEDKGYIIKLWIQPYIGPHFPVGDDEVEYFVNNLGTITLLSYSHKRNYELPERLGVRLKKPIPIS